jgi:peptidoglycan-associated lipoprotein
MKKFWLGLAVVLASALILGGCGGSKTKAPAPAAEEAAKPAPPPPAAAAPPAQAEAPRPPEPVVTEPKEMDREPVTERPPQVAVTEPPPIEEPPRAEAQAPPAVAEQAPPDRPVPVVEAPPQPVAGAPEYGVVYFDFDKYNIKPEFEGVIKQNAQSLSGNGATVIVEGHCDERGTTEYNLALGERRAKAVRDALVQQGVSAGHLEIVSYGEERPAAMGHDEAAWSQNRRTVLTTK